LGIKLVELHKVRTQFRLDKTQLHQLKDLKQLQSVLQLDQLLRMHQPSPSDFNQQSQLKDLLQWPLGSGLVVTIKDLVRLLLARVLVKLLKLQTQ
jgi:hypothetical protein